MHSSYRDYKAWNGNIWEVRFREWTRSFSVWCFLETWLVWNPEQADRGLTTNLMISPEKQPHVGCALENIQSTGDFSFDIKG